MALEHARLWARPAPIPFHPDQGILSELPVGCGRMLPVGSAVLSTCASSISPLALHLRALTPSDLGYTVAAVHPLSLGPAASSGQA